MNIGLIFPLLAGLTWGISSILLGKGSRELPLGTYLLLTNIMGLVFFVGGIPIPKTPQDFGLLLLITMSLLISAIAFYLSLRTEDVHVVLPFTSANSLVTLIISTVLAGEKLSLMQIVGALLTCIGAMLIAMEKPRKLKLTPAVPYLIITVLGWGTAPVIAKYLPFSAFQSTAVISLGFVIVGLAMGGRLVLEAPALLGGFLANVGLILELIGISLIGAALSGAIVPAESIVPFVYEKFVEKKHIRQHRWLGLISLMLGLALISLG